MKGSARVFRGLLVDTPSRRVGKQALHEETNGIQRASRSLAVFAVYRQELARFPDSITNGGLPGCAKAVDLNFFLAIRTRADSAQLHDVVAGPYNM